MGKNIKFMISIASILYSIVINIKYSNLGNVHTF